MSDFGEQPAFEQPPPRSFYPPGSGSGPLPGPPPPGPTLAPLASSVRGIDREVTGKRIVAGLLDLVPLTFLAVALGDRSAEGAQFDVDLGGWRVLWWLLAAVTYYAVAELLTTTSPGKAIMGLHVTDDLGGSPRASRILARNVARIVDILPAAYLVGFVAVAVSSDNRRLGDMAADTLVLGRGATSALGAVRVSILSLVVAACIGTGVAVIVLDDSTERIGSFDVEEEVVPYVEQVVDEAFRPISAEGIRRFVASGVASDEELASFVAQMESLAGSVTGNLEIVDQQIASYPLPGVGEVESVDFLISTEFENGPGQLILTVSDVDGELQLIGFRFAL